MFTSIPLKETINTAVDLLFYQNPYFKISKNKLKILCLFRSIRHFFPFDGSFYDQIDDVAIGSPLGPVLANLVMGYHEANWLRVFKDCETNLYRRYVDDIIRLFNCYFDADKFYEFLNKPYSNIALTFEKKNQSNQASKLDVI